MTIQNNKKLLTKIDFELWNDKDIVQDNSRNSSSGRVYRHGEREFSSVTNILGTFEDKEFLVKWKADVGEKEADRIRDTAAAHGTSVHGELESYFRLQYPQLILNENPHLKDLLPEQQEVEVQKIQESILAGLHSDHERLIKPFQRLFPFIRPVALEKRLMWHSKCGRFGFGGTPDAIGLVNCNLLPPTAKPIYTDSQDNYALAVMDWKNFNKKKRPIEYNRKGCSYYPLIKYALQLAAYSAGINQLTEGRYRLNQGVLACAYNTSKPGEEMSYELDVFYFSQRSLMWFWERFQEMLESYYLSTPVSFNWKKFCTQAHTAGVLGEEIAFEYKVEVDEQL